jgi:hypothetical protein
VLQQVYNAGVGGGGGPSHPPNTYTPDDIPKTVARTLNQGSCVMSMDFHPVQQTILLGNFFVVSPFRLLQVSVVENVEEVVGKIWVLTATWNPKQWAPTSEKLEFGK